MNTALKERRIKLSWGELGEIRIRTNAYADDVHEGLKLMLRHLKATGQVELWKLLVRKSGDDVLEIYRRYQRNELGKVIFAETVESAKSVMLDWASKRPNETTRKSYREYINNLFRDHPTATIAELPDVLRAVRDRYEARGQKNTFDQCRKVASSWAGKTYSKDSPLWRQLRAVQPLEVSSHVHTQKARQVWEVVATVDKMAEPYGSMFWTMCLLGTGRKEYLSDGFDVVPDHYVRIFGKKNKNRTRVVPLIFDATQLVAPDAKTTLSNNQLFREALQKVQPDWQLMSSDIRN